MTSARNRLVALSALSLALTAGCGAFISPADGVDADGTTPKEAECLDLWSLVHFTSGYLVGTQLGEENFVPTVGILSGYEVLEREIWPEFDESLLNQRCDVVVGSIGWMVESLASD